MKNVQYVYKCIYLKCKAYYKKKEFLKDHLIKINHFENTEKNLKCAFYSCNYVTNKYTDLFVHNSNHPGYDKDVLKEIYDFLKHMLNFENNPKKYENSTFCNLKCEMQYTLHNLFLKHFNMNMIFTYKDNKYRCLIPGCQKMFTSREIFKMHIKTYFHSIDKFLSILDKNCRIFLNENCENIFIENVALWLFNEKDWVHSIQFRNDLNKSKDENLSSIKHNKKADEIPYINTVYYKKFFSDKISEFFHENLGFYNLKECITCACKISNMSLIVIGTKTNFTKIDYANLNITDGKLSFFNLNLKLLEFISFDYGFPIKIIASIKSAFFCLFSDGKIRKFLYENTFSCIFCYDTEKCLDFAVVENEIIYWTDGLQIFKMIDGINIIKSGYFQSFINCLLVRTRLLKENLSFDANNKDSECCKKINTISDNYDFLLNTEHNNLNAINKNIDDKTIASFKNNENFFNDLKNKTNSYFILCNTVNGNIFALDKNLQNKISLIKNFYTHKIIYSEISDSVFFTNQLYNSTKILIIEDTYVKTKFVNQTPFYSCFEDKDGIYFGDFYGTIKRLKYKNKKYKNTLYLKIVKNQSSIYFYEDENESYNNHLECCVIDILKCNYFIFVFLKCGIFFRVCVNG